MVNFDDDYINVDRGIALESLTALECDDINVDGAGELSCSTSTPSIQVTFKAS